MIIAKELSNKEGSNRHIDFLDDNDMRDDHLNKAVDLENVKETVLLDPPKFKRPTRRLKNPLNTTHFAKDSSDVLKPKSILK